MYILSNTKVEVDLSVHNKVPVLNVCTKLKATFAKNYTVYLTSRSQPVNNERSSLLLWISMQLSTVKHERHTAQCHFCLSYSIYISKVPYFITFNKTSEFWIPKFIRIRHTLVKWITRVNLHWRGRSHYFLQATLLPKLQISFSKFRYLRWNSFIYPCHSKIVHRLHIFHQMWQMGKHLLKLAKCPPRLPLPAYIGSDCLLVLIYTM